MPDRTCETPRIPLDGGGALCGTFSYTAAVNADAVVFVHGFGSTRGGEKATAVEAACTRRGWTFAAFDFRGHGESSGALLDLRASCLQQDLERVCAYLAQRGATRLFLVGSSMGGFVGAWFARRHPDVVLACAAIAPAFNFVARFSRLTAAEQEKWKATGRLRIRNPWLDVEIGPGVLEEADQFRLEDLAAGWCSPLLIFHGMRDEVVSYTDSLDLFQRTTYPEVELHLFKDGDHRLVAYKDEMAEAICRFLRGTKKGDKGMSRLDNGKSPTPAATARCPRRIVRLKGGEHDEAAEVLLELHGDEITGKRLHAEVQRLGKEHAGQIVAAEWQGALGWTRFLWCRK